MIKYCNQIEKDKDLAKKYCRNLEKAAEWYIRQHKNYESMLRSEMIKQLVDFEFELDEQWDSFNILDNYEDNFGAKLNLFVVADILSKHMLSTFSFGPENTEVLNFSNVECAKSWFEYNGDVRCVSEILYYYMVQNYGGCKGIDLSVLQEERNVRNRLTHAGDISVCLSAIRCYNIIRKMLLFMDESLEGKLPEFESPDLSECDMQGFFSHTQNLELNNGDSTTILVIGSMLDMKKSDLKEFLNLPWNLVLDFSGGDLNGGMRMLVEHRQIHKQKITHSLASTVISQLRLNLNYTEWMVLGDYLSPFYKSKSEREKAFIENMILGKEPFYHGTGKGYKKYLSNILNGVCKAAAKQMRPVNIIYVYYDISMAKSFLRECEELLDSVTYSFTGVYYWDKEAIEQIKNNVYDYEIEKDELEQQFAVFPCALDKFLSGLNKYDIGNRENMRDVQREEKKLPSADGDMEISQNLAYDLERFFEVLYKGIGEKDPESHKKIQDFFHGKEAPWVAFQNNRVVDLVSKSDNERYINKIKSVLGRIPDKKSDKILYLSHVPGIGGSTMLRSIGWALHDDYPVLLINSYDKIDTEKHLRDLYDTVKKPFVVLADENFSCLEELENDIKNIQRPCILVASIRESNIVISKYDKIQLKRISGKAETQLRELFKDNSSLSVAEKKEKDDGYKDFIDQDITSMRSPFMIGLYYMEKEFYRIGDYISQIITAITDVKEFMAVGFISMADIYGQEALPKIFVNKFLGISPREDYVKGHSYIQSALLSDNKMANYRSKHHLLSLNLLDQCSLRLYGVVFEEKIFDWSKNFIDAVLRECQSGFQEKYQIVLEQIFIKNKITNEGGDNQTSFSKLIETEKIPERRVKILEYLAKQSEHYAKRYDPEKEPKVYMMTSHFYGHLARLYSKKDSGIANYNLAIDTSQLSMHYMKLSGGEDSRVYHMHAETIKNKLQYDWDQLALEDELGECNVSKEMYENFEDEIRRACDIYDQAAQYGSPDYAYTSEISLLINYLEFVYEKKHIYSEKDLRNLSEEQQQMRMDINSIIDILEGIELDDNAYEFYNRMLDEYYNNIMLNDFGSTIEYYENGLTNALQNGEIASIVESKREGLINARIAKCKIKSSSGLRIFNPKTPADEVETILKLIETAMDQGFDNSRFNSRQRRASLYNRWFIIAKYSNRTVSNGIEVALQWKDIVEFDKRIDPRPYYYLYVLYYLSVLEGNVDNEKNIEEFRRLSEKKATQAGRKLDVMQDILLDGKGMAQLRDTRSVESLVKAATDSSLKKRELGGRFVEIITKVGAIELRQPKQWIRKRAKFRMLERNTVGESQYSHDVKFYGGFSFEQIVAINESVKDITAGEEFSSHNIVTSKKILEESVQSEEGKCRRMAVENTMNERVLFYPKYLTKTLSGDAYLNGSLADGRQGGINSGDIERFGKKVKKYGGGINILQLLKEVTEFEVIVSKKSLANKDRYTLSIYETKIDLDEFLEPYMKPLNNFQKQDYSRIKSVRFYPDKMQYKYDRRNRMQLNGTVDENKQAKLISTDIERFPEEEVDAFGGVESIMEQLEQMKIVDACVFKENRNECTISLYETNRSLGDILKFREPEKEGGKEKSQNNVTVQNVERQEVGLPELKGEPVVFKDFIVKGTSLVGMIEVEGKQYSAMIPSLKGKAIKDMKKKKSINAKVISQNEKYYILRV